MLFNWTYLLIIIASTTAYYAYFKKYASLFFPLCSLLILSFWDLKSTILALLLTFITFVVKHKFPTKSGFVIALHLFILLAFKTELLWTGDNNTTTQNFIFLGLSYFSLQNISVLLDRKNSISLPNLMTSNLFFPKFIAGPILLSKEINTFQWSTSFNIRNIASGIQRILYGLAKKLILADRLSIISNNVFNADHHYQTIFSIGFSSIIFTIQMYIDFSAYSDIAIGTARLFGIDLKENFNRPLRSTSISEYWRKTHISLIDWLTNHLYYPIVYTFRKYTHFSVATAILVTFVVSGYWHGSYIGYLIWGTLNGTYLLFEYTWKKLKFKQPNKLTGLFLSLSFLSFSNLFFKVKTWDGILKIFSNLTTNKILPNDWMIEFIAIIGNGGHLIQQYNLLETTALLIAFLSFEKKLEQQANNTKFSYLYLFFCILSILFFGNFNAGDEFIYVQF